MSRLILKIALVAMLAWLCLAAEDPVEESPIDGGWVWTFTMPDGSTVKPRAQLKARGSNLIGVCKFRPGGETVISEGKIIGETVSFEVVRERPDRKIITRYSGKVADGHIRGKIESNWDGDFQSYDWDAVTTTQSIEGKWEWPSGNRKRALELTWEGKQLTGRLIMEDGAEFPLRNVSLKEGAFSLEAEREREGRPYTNIFHGRLEENVLKGKIDRIFDGQTNSSDWEAKRAK